MGIFYTQKLEGGWSCTKKEIVSPIWCLVRHHYTNTDRPVQKKRTIGLKFLDRVCLSQQKTNWARRALMESGLEIFLKHKLDKGE